MASIGESSSSVPKLMDEKPVLVRVKRKASQSRLDALWLEINERPLKRPLLDFENLSISETFHKEELKTKKIFVQHVETLRSSEATVDIVQSFVAPDAACNIENNLKNEERRRNFKRDISRQDQLLVKARQEQEAVAKNARFEQIWRSRKGVKDAKDDQLHDIYHIYDIVRLDANEISSEAPKEEQMSLEDQSMLSSYLPLLREFIPSAAAEIESDIDANMMKQDWRLLEAKRSQLVWSPCAAHCIDLMLEDIYKIPNICKAYKRGMEISNFIYVRPGLLNMMRRFTNTKELIKPAKTRFATACITLSSIHRQKNNLRKMFTFDKWKNSQWSKEQQGKRVVQTILLVSFWTTIVFALEVFGPLVRVLRLVDGEKKPPMGYIYEAIDRAKEAIAKSFNDREEKYKGVFIIIDKRWELQLHRPLHAAGYYLNASFYHSNPNIQEDDEIVNGLYSCITKMVAFLDIQDKILAELSKYKRAEGLFGQTLAIRQRDKISLVPVDDYVYDYYTVKNNVEIADDDASNPFPLIQVDDLDLYDGPDDSDYESDDSNAENNPCFDYPDEISEEEELENETSNDELEDNDDDKQSSESNDQEEDEFSEEDKAQLYEDEIYGDFDEDDAESFDYDSNGGHDEGEDCRWSNR